MAIRILKEEQPLDLNPNFTVEMKLTSPIYSAEGSQSISNTLPISAKNNRLLKYPLHYENADKVQDIFSVLLEDGSFRQSCELSIQGGSKSEGIAFNLGFDEAILYAKLKEKKLADIDLPVLESPFASIRDKIQAIVSFLEAQRASIDSELTVFPIVLRDDTVDETNYQYVLNPVELKGTSPGQQPILWEARSDIQVINGEVATLSVPDGYGVAPFLKVWRIIELIFDRMEYRIVENRFKTHRQLKLLTVLHNCADSICEGKLNFSDLMPDETVLNFLDSLFAKFGAVFFVNSIDKSIKIKLLDEILSSSQYEDLTKKQSSEYTWTRIPQKQIKLKLNTNLQDATPGAESQNAFLKSYNYIISQVSDINDDNSFTAAYERPTGRYYRKNNIEGNVKVEYVGSVFFDWNAIERTEEIEEISGTDASVPMIRSSAYGIIPYFINPMKHVNTNLVSQSIQEKEKEDNNCPLSFIFYFGSAPAGNSPHPEPFYFASSYNIARNNTTLLDPDAQPYPLALTGSSLFNNFWKQWDAILRHANQQYELDINLSKIDILSLETSKKIMINNQPFLIEELNFQLGDQNTTSKIKIRSLALKKPYNLDDEQHTTDTESPQYYWVYQNFYEQELAEVIRLNEIPDNGSGWYRAFLSDELITFPTPENTQTLLPPSEEDYLANRTETRYFQARAQFRDFDPSYGTTARHYVLFDYTVIYSIQPIV